ncbi:hypothetical protein ASE90_00905 [Sphingomonas sp. Leaf67]|uniref:DUF1178 family protein n=1 Tax=Sphingomonas sp. Leaf67 TaxID=1736230 RepID=UPI0006F98DD0|nr:DUF1178 family protein [Sphingomonas sp. Leaf67]KQN91413.1 hypothetical protein ASE90_00905 [Sphingomonas sp. Leaf67]
MIVFDLRCSNAHVFEAWFASSGAYVDQRAQGLIRCPFCDDVTIEKAVMAPNISPKGGRSAGRPPEAMKAALQALAQAQQAALSNSEWVGTAFADRARAMHVGDAEPATIHGQATRAEAKALVEEGVPVAPLLLPVVPPERAN